MKAIDSSMINKSAKTTSARPEEACPTCGCASWGFENGLVHCIDHGYFEPEPTDVRLYAMQVRFNQQHGLVFPLAGMEPEVQVPVVDDFVSRHRPVPASITHAAPRLRIDDLPPRGPMQMEIARGTQEQSGLDRLVLVPGAAPAASTVTMTHERVDGDIQGAYTMGSRARS